MKKLKQVADIGTCLVLAASFAFTLIVHVATASAFSGSGSGTIGDPYIITSCTQLQEISSSLSAYYALGSDIDCSDTVNWNNSYGFIPIGQTGGFSGQLDGRGFTVSGLVIGASGNGQGYSNDAALFLQTGHATIKNLNISNLNADGQEETAALVDNAYGTVISNVHVDAVSMSTDDGNFGITGGVVAFMHNDSAINSISQSSFTNSAISGGSAVGGLVGYMDDGSQISTSYGSDNAIDSNQQAGGLVAIMVGESTLKDSYSTGLALSSFNGMAGGLVGQLGNNAPPVPSITNTYASGAVSSSSDYSGGLVGYAAGAISNSFAVTSTTGNGVTEGGLSGTLASSDGGSSTYNVYDVYQTSEADCSGSVPAANCLANLDILPVNQNNAAPNYFFDNNTNRPMDKWDFTNTWALMDTNTPVLVWQGIGHAPPAQSSGSGGASDNTPAQQTPAKPSLQQVIKNLASSDGSLPAEISLDNYADYSDGSGQQLSNLAVGQVLGFVIDNNGATEHHTATVKTISGDTVTFTIASTPFDTTIKVGQSQTISLDGKNVLKITLNSITNGLANATFANLATPLLSHQSSIKTGAESVVASKSHTLIYIGLGVLVLAIVSGMVVWKRRQAVKTSVII